MDVRFAARMAAGLGLAFVGLIGLRGEAFAQYYSPSPSAPGYRAAPLNDDDDFPPPPRSYGRAI